MAQKEKKNDIWEDIFNKYKIPEEIEKNGKFEISSTQINEFREARLMTKFDNSQQLPSIFKKHKLSLLPITRGSYVIAPLDTFFKFPDLSKYKVEIKYIEFPKQIQSLSPENITSESMALNCAYVSGILKDFIEDDELIPTVNGRMSSESFEFSVNNTINKQKTSIVVNSSQMEIDAGYEGVETLSLIEAKNNMAEEFMVRQLYYPFRKWSALVTKSVKTIFMVYSNSIFYLYDYKFKDVNDYNSLELNKFKKYSLKKLDIDIEDLKYLVKNVITVSETEIPFPQADAFERIINLCELLINGHLTKKEISNIYLFELRQADYYFNAGKYLGLMDINEKKEIYITDKGKKILSLPVREKQLSLASAILEHVTFKKVLKQNLNDGTIPNKDEIIKIMKQDNLYKVNTEEMYKRRSSTVSAWINWITSLINS